MVKKSWLSWNVLWKVYKITISRIVANPTAMSMHDFRNCIPRHLNCDVKIPYL